MQSYYTHEFQRAVVRAKRTTTQDLADMVNLGRTANAWDERFTLLGMTTTLLVDGRVEESEVCDRVVRYNTAEIYYPSCPSACDRALSGRDAV